MFRSLISDFPQPIEILDVGGTQRFWEIAGWTGEVEVKVTLLNVFETEATRANFNAIIGDGRDLRRFQDKAFDVVFSNSVLEHVGGMGEQRRMAEEVRRVGKALFIQTPNRYFPVEPHFLLPFFQFLPLKWRVYLVRHFSLGWFQKISDQKKAKETVCSINLLSEKELEVLFPEAHTYREKVFGLTKSFIVIQRSGACQC